MISEIQSIPGYESMTDQQIADAVNASRVANTGNLVTGRFLNERGLYNLLGPVDGETFLATLSAAAVDNPVLTRVVNWLTPEKGGIDVGIASTQAQLNALSDANGGPLPAALANQVRDYGLNQKPDVTAQQVTDALSAYAAGATERRFQATVEAGRAAIDAGDDATAIKAAIDAAWSA